MASNRSFLSTLPLMMKFFLAPCLFAAIAVNGQKTITLSRALLKDKIRGGWAGQTIGVTFGGPYEFRFDGTFIQDYQPLVWYEGYLKKTMTEIPGLYDDLYMDLTFVGVMEKYGLDAPVDSFAQAFAHAGYMLWHANQAARYNILNGIPAPRSGYWQNNPHSDDIDYQIESDFAGLMSPGMPNTASEISDRVGHIMNYGDGWYGGVFIGAMYSLAFLSSDLDSIVEGALKTIPARSTFYQCIHDVVEWHKKYPDDWHDTWFAIQKKWSGDVACAEGVFRPFDIDAKVNSAYVVMALLYGKGDFTKTLEIATRAGQDADCNPSSAGGILGTISGYDKIPPFWKLGLKEIEDINFKYTDYSLNKTYAVSLQQALENVRRHGGKISADAATITVQDPAPVRLEQGFPNLHPIGIKESGQDDIRSADFDFAGTGFELAGQAEKKSDSAADYIFQAAVTIDGGRADTVALPTSSITRRHELCWKFGLPPGQHKVSLRLLNPDSRYRLNTGSFLFFSDAPVGDLIPTH